METHLSQSKDRQRSLDRYEPNREGNETGTGFRRIKRRTRRIHSVCAEETIIEEEWPLEAGPRDV